MHLYYKKLLTYYSILQCVCFLKSENNFYQTSNSGAKNLMLHDMMMAFRPIANSNSTNYIENMVTHMYNFHKTKSAMIFKLPYNSENLQLLQPPDTPSHRVIFMERQQFIQPTFPNLTKSYMILRRYKFSKRPINANITQLLIKEMQEINRASLYDEWAHLGLNGWNGDIAGSSSSPEQHLNNNKLIAPTINDYPVHEITKDLTQFDPNNSVYLQEIAANALMEKNDLAAMRQELDNNIYIARANDPFGYSTKWQMIKSNQTKSKRGVLQLYSMVKCSTNCDPFGYKGYGCYCGFLGHGRPTDGIDRCCKIHDKCYENTNCIWGLEYFAPYVWKCYRGKPTCAIDHGEWGGPDSCAASLCRCDLSLSRCLRQYACPKRRAVCRSSISRRLENILLQ